MTPEESLGAVIAFVVTPSFISAVFRKSPFDVYRAPFNPAQATFRNSLLTGENK
jgi:hypothetical protein